MRSHEFIKQSPSLEELYDEEVQSVIDGYSVIPVVGESYHIMTIDAFNEGGHKAVTITLSEFPVEISKIDGDDVYVKSSVGIKQLPHPLYSKVTTDVAVLFFKTKDDMNEIVSYISLKYDAAWDLNIDEIPE